MHACSGCFVEAVGVRHGFGHLSFACLTVAAGFDWEGFPWWL